MNQSQLIDQMAAKAGTTKKQAEYLLNAFIATVTDEVADGGEVKLVGFGAFSRVYSKPRTGRNPQTGDEMEIPGKHKPKFKAGAVFCRQVAERDDF
ncbi:MAG: HU family DNA-binding protein [Cyanobacteria bacterium P01_F01_bin.56]